MDLTGNSFPRAALLLLCGWGVCGGCTPGAYRREADQVAYDIIGQERRAALGHAGPFTIERPADTLRRRLFTDQELPSATPISLGTQALSPIDNWPDPAYLEEARAEEGRIHQPGGKTLNLTLVDALRIGARNSRDYQTQKELVFQAALRLDLERNEFRGFWSLFGESEMIRDLGNRPPQSGIENTAVGSLSRTTQFGATFVFNLGLDLVKLLTQDRSSSLGIFGDATVSLPLLRGAGRLVVTEPLTQAQREVVYAIYTFERFKRQFAVRVATDYLGVLQLLDQVQNAEENYRGLIGSTRRARRMATAGRLPEIQVDQSTQDELRARNRWILENQSYERRLDNLKALLGLPTDAAVVLDRTELQRLQSVVELTPTARDDDEAPLGAEAAVELEAPTDEDAGPFEMKERAAIALAFQNRLDLRVAVGRVLDAQRGVLVAADALRADLTLLGSADTGERRSLTSARADDGGLRPERGRYSALLSLDLPLERTAERNFYRNSLISLEQAIRDVQELEDQIKLDVRDNLRTLLAARESLRIQEEAVRVARRRVQSTDLFLRAGRAQIRDVLEAKEDLVSAQNALTSARVQYRVSEFEFQRNLDVLEVNEEGMWQEFTPETSNP